MTDKDLVFIDMYRSSKKILIVFLINEKVLIVAIFTQHVGRFLKG